MDKPTGTSRIDTEAELEAFVRSLHAERAALYSHLSGEMEKLGESELETICRSLRGDTAPQDPRNGSLSQVFNHQPDLAVLRSPYELWAFAVRQEEELFNALTSANLAFGKPQLRSRLASEAHASLDRAARYRAQRRLAFHAARLSNEIAMFPDIRRIDLVEDLACVALVIERYFLRLLMSVEKKNAQIRNVVSHTKQTIASLEQQTEELEIPKRLVNQVKRLGACDPQALLRNDEPARARAKVVLEAGRIFDYYDRVFQTSQDQEVAELAQQLSADMLERLLSLQDADKPA